MNPDEPAAYNTGDLLDTVNACLKEKQNLQILWVGGCDQMPKNTVRASQDFYGSNAILYFNDGLQLVIRAGQSPPA